MSGTVLALYLHRYLHCSVLSYLI